MTERGKLVVFEGINGCGKGTQITRFIDELFRDRSKTIFLTREPNYFDDNGRKARELLNSDGDPYLNQLEALAYFTFSRITHNGIFSPMLDKGIDVVSDRYYHSTFAFQHAQGIPYEKIAHHNKDPRIMIPDLTVLIDIPVDVAFERLGKRHNDRRSVDRGEPERRKFDRDFKFMEKVRSNYLELPEILPNLIGDKSIVVIDGTGTPEEVSARVLDAYRSRLAA